MRIPSDRIISVQAIHFSQVAEGISRAGHALIIPKKTKKISRPLRPQVREDTDSDRDAVDVNNGEQYLIAGPCKLC